MVESKKQKTVGLILQQPTSMNEPGGQECFQAELEAEEWEDEEIERHEEEAVAHLRHAEGPAATFNDPAGSVVHSDRQPGRRRAHPSPCLPGGDVAHVLPVRLHAEAPRRQAGERAAYAAASRVP